MAGMRPEPHDDQVPAEQEVAAVRRPQLLGNAHDHVTDTDQAAAGAVWRLEPSERDLDANVIAIPPGGRIDRHRGPALDVLVHVLSGGGELVTASEVIALVPGALIWLPRGSEREFRAAGSGLRYFSVHRRNRAALTITAQPPRS